MIKKLLTTCVLGIAVMGCAKEGLYPGAENPIVRKAKVVFSVNLKNEIGADMDVTTKANETVGASYLLNEMWYYVFNSGDSIVPAPNGDSMRYLTRNDLGSLNDQLEEELPVGRYTIVALGLADTNSRGSVDLQTLRRHNDVWLQTNMDEKLPVRGEYFHGSSSFNITSNQSFAFPLTLSRAVGKVELDLIASQNLKNRITQLVVRYDEGMLCTRMTADGNVSGNLKSVQADVSQSRYFFSLPSSKKTGVSGNILVTVVMNNGTLKSKTFNFTEAPILKNQRTLIHLTLTEMAQSGVEGAIKVEGTWGKDIDVPIEVK